MEHAEHVALIRRGVEGAGPRWLEIGAGEGAFTLALADVLGADARIVAVDRDARALERLTRAMHGRFAPAALERIVTDFTRELPDGPFDGVLAANSLHFVRERGGLLARLREQLGPDGRLVVVEYDADRGNPWVPHPFSFSTWRREALDARFSEPELIHRVPSRFLGAIYGAVSHAFDAG